MKHKILKANKYYREQLPDGIIFYKLNEGFVAFGSDMPKISKLLGVSVVPKHGLQAVVLPHQDFLDHVDILRQCGIPFQSIIYRDANGKFAVPDVDLLREEQEIDY